MQTLDAAIALSEEVGNIQNLGHSRINRCGLYALQGRYEEARVEAEEGLADGGALKNVRILQTGNFNCYRALAAAGEGRARDFLQRAAGHPESQADKIADPELRRSFLTDIEENRLIMARSGRI